MPLGENTRWQGSHAAAHQVPLCLNFDFTYVYSILTCAGPSRTLLLHKSGSACNSALCSIKVRKFLDQLSDNCSRVILMSL